MSLTSIIVTAAENFDLSDGVTKSNDFNEFIHLIKSQNPRNVDAFACLKQFGSSYFIEHSGKIPVMQYYVSLTANATGSVIQFNEPVASELLQTPPMIYAKNRTYSEITKERAWGLLNLIKEESPHIYTRLYDFDQNFLCSK